MSYAEWIVVIPARYGDGGNAVLVLADQSATVDDVVRAVVKDPACLVRDGGVLRVFPVPANAVDVKVRHRIEVES